MYIPSTFCTASKVTSKPMLVNYIRYFLLIICAVIKPFWGLHCHSQLGQKHRARYHCLIKATTFTVGWKAFTLRVAKWKNSCIQHLPCLNLISALSEIFKLPTWSMKSPRQVKLHYWEKHAARPQATPAQTVGKLTRKKAITARPFFEDQGFGILKAAAPCVWAARWWSSSLV